MVNSILDFLSKPWGAISFTAFIIFIVVLILKGKLHFKDILDFVKPSQKVVTTTPAPAKNEATASVAPITISVNNENTNVAAEHADDIGEEESKKQQLSSAATHIVNVVENEIDKRIDIEREINSRFRDSRDRSIKKAIQVLSLHAKIGEMSDTRDKDDYIYQLYLETKFTAILKNQLNRIRDLRDKLLIITPLSQAATINEAVQDALIEVKRTIRDSRTFDNELLYDIISKNQNIIADQIKNALDEFISLSKEEQQRIDDLLEKRKATLANMIEFAVRN